MKSKLFFAFTLLTQCLFAQPTVTLQQYVTGFSSPVDIANCGDERLFVVERAGFIRIIENGMRLTTPFLDIDSKVINGGGEQGLLGLAFHPDYKNNGYFFVYYVNNSGNLSISRFSVTSDPNIADPNSEVVVLPIAHPTNSNHNGGNLDFGPDGYLYIATGDGGGGGDPDNNAQNPLSLLGKMLRLDVDSLPYTFPPDNPFVPMASVRNEIWALGLRNPWRFSFDRLTGDLWIGDVGQNAREEVNFQPASSTGGENYGWRCYEGNLTYNTNGCGAMGTYKFPIRDFDNPTLGCSVVGGYVYRGCKYPGLFGYYLYTDYCTGIFWTLHNDNGTWVNTQLFDDANSRYVAFGEDYNGELYVAGLNGIVYQVQEATAASLPTIVVQGNTSFCTGDSARLSTALTGFTSYEWLKDGTSVTTGMQLTADESGSYALRVTGSNGCVYTTPPTVITENPLPIPSIVSASNSYCIGDSLLLSTGTYSAYQWSNGATTQSIYVQQGTYEVTVTDANGCSAGSGSPGVSIIENALPQPEILQTGTLCGAANSVSLSTTAPYSVYTWSTTATTATITVNQAGNYTVTVTDANGCAGVSALHTVVVQFALTPALAAQNGSDICPGSSTILSLPESYATYQWSTGATDSTITVSTAGNYWVSVTDNFGCAGNSDTLTISILAAPAPTVISQNGTAVCSGGSNELSLSGSYTTYTWSTGETTPTINASSAGDYSAVVIDSVGCTGNSDTLSVSLLPAPVPHIFQGDSAKQCGSEPVELFTTDTYVSYAWSSGATSPVLFVSTAGTYNVTVEGANGCAGVSNDIVVEFYPNPPRPQTTVTNSWIGTADSGYAAYQWYYLDENDSAIVLEAETLRIIDGLNLEPWVPGNGGDFFVEVTDINGCPSVSDTIFLLWEGIEETWLESISIQPNPFSNEILLTYTLKDLVDVRISLKDLAGKEVALLLNEKKGAGSYKLAINTAKYQLSKGFYFLEIGNGASRKILKLEKM